MHPKDANSMAASGLVSRNDLAGTGRAISVLFGVRNISISPCRASISQHSRPTFQQWQVGISLKT